MYKRQDYSYTDDLAQLGTIVGEVADILEQEDLHRPGTASSQPKDNSIQLKDVRCAYGEKEVLHGVSLRIEPGTVNALVGPSGSGKSTIAPVSYTHLDVYKRQAVAGTRLKKPLPTRGLPADKARRFPAIVLSTFSAMRNPLVICSCKKPMW